MANHIWVDPEHPQDKQMVGDGSAGPFPSLGIPGPTSSREMILAREVLRLAGFKGALEQVALAAGCLPTQFADAYGHVLDAVTALRIERDRLAEEVERLRAEKQEVLSIFMKGPDVLLAAERARIRRGLLEEVQRLRETIRPDDAWDVIDAPEMIAALDRIVPEDAEAVQETRWHLDAPVPGCECSGCKDLLATEIDRICPEEG